MLVLLRQEQEAYVGTYADRWMVSLGSGHLSPVVHAALRQHVWSGIPAAQEAFGKYKA